MNQIFTVTEMGCTVCQTWAEEPLSVFVGATSTRIKWFQSRFLAVYGFLIYSFKKFQSFKNSGAKYNTSPHSLFEGFNKPTRLNIILDFLLEKWDRCYMLPLINIGVCQWRTGKVYKNWQY